jgi:DNA-binding transcriptional ArsR family regulator
MDAAIRRDHAYGQGNRPDRMAFVNASRVALVLIGVPRGELDHCLVEVSRPRASPSACATSPRRSIGQRTVSHHLGKLKAAGLVDSFKRGVWALYRLCDDLPDAAGAAVATIPDGRGTRSSPPQGQQRITRAQSLATDPRSSCRAQRSGQEAF